MRFRRERLIEKCRLLMSDGSPWTNTAMAEALDCAVTGAAARIRDLRKAKYGNHRISKRLKAGGYFEYFMESEKKEASNA